MRGGRGSWVSDRGDASSLGKAEKEAIATFLSWIGWTLIAALILGGKPWRFPQGGEPLLDAIEKRVKVRH